MGSPSALQASVVVTRQAGSRGDGNTKRPVADGSDVVGVLSERLVAIVTVSDLLEALGRGIDRPAKGTRPMVTHRVPHRKQRRAGSAW